MDLLYGYSVFRLITEQIDDDRMPDRISAVIATLARSGVLSPDRAKKRSRSKQVASSEPASAYENTEPAQAERRQRKLSSSKRI